MKKFILGRGEDCDVYLNDTKGLISRKHAILKTNLIGQYEITDVSKNGTFINGIRMKPHVPYKVKRKDIIVFANTSKLDWDDIPNYSKWIKIGLFGMVVLLAVVIVCLIVIINPRRHSSADKTLHSMPQIENAIEQEQEKSSEASIYSTEESNQTSDFYPTKPNDTPTEYSKTNYKVEDKQKKAKKEQTVSNEEKQSEEMQITEPQKVEEEKSPGGD